MGRKPTEATENPAVAPVERRVFNAEFLRSFTFGEADLEAEVIGLFLAELPSLKARIMASLESSDWLHEIHRLRGSALGIGAERLADAAKAAEGLGIEDEADRLRALADVTDEIAILEADLAARGFRAAA